MENWGYTDSQFAAMRYTDDLADILAEQFPLELAEFYRNVELTNLDIAYEILPCDEVGMYPVKCAKAVGMAVRMVMDDKERIKLTKSRRSRVLSDRIANDPEWHTGLSVSASRARINKGIKSGWQLMKNGIPVAQWEFDEREKLFELVGNPEFHHVKGPHVGRPDYKKIAEEINRIFHNGKPVREQYKLMRVVASDEKNKKRREKARMQSSARYSHLLRDVSDAK